MLKYIAFFFRREHNIDSMITDQLKQLEAKLKEIKNDLLDTNDVSRKVLSFSLNENYIYKSENSYDSHDQEQRGYGSNNPAELWSQKYQFLKKIQQTRSSQGSIDAENLETLKKQFPRACEGVFSMTSKIVSLIEKNFEREQLLTPVKRTK